MNSGSKQLHDKIIQDTMLILGKKAAHIGRFWPHPTGMAYRDHGGWREYIHYGLPGSADIIGIISRGRIVCIEIKSGEAVQQLNQKRFEIMIKKFHGIYIVARSAKEALDSLLRVANV